ncbi:hypothetical protein FOCC_FOCC013029 [Frankliniella occidentalis]|nr:hypothetical protein FOCC_FOCC013029 [Frankliniella occidentalis]
MRDQQCEMPPAYDTEQWIPTPDVPANASVVERKCLAFQLLEFMLDEVLAVATLPGQPYFCKRWCFSDRAVAFVSGGQDAVELEFPHMALFLDDRDEAYCSGTLISESFVLTAAHCAVPSRVVLGLLRISDRAGEHVREVRRVAEHIVHPDFYRSGGAHSDIALLRLGERVRFTPHVRPACLYTGDDAHLQEAVVTGWGYQQYDSGEGVAAQSKVTSDALQKAAVNVTKCPEELGTDIPHEKHICALGKKDSQEAFSDACQGDSGGPLQVMTAGGPGRCSYRVVAVVSRGRGCGTNLPGLYTSVSKFADWIQSWVWPCEK